MKKRHCLSMLAWLLCLLCMATACTSTSGQTSSESTTTVQTEQTESPAREIVLAERGGKTDFKLVYQADTDARVRNNILQIREAFVQKLNVELKPVDDFFPKLETDYEIIVGSEKREACVALTQTLANGEYAIKAETDGTKIKILIAYKGEIARMCAIERFIEEYVNEERAAVPEDLDIKGSCKEKDALITSSIEQLRDPCILVEDGVYYAYGTGWVCYKNTSGSLRGTWKSLGVVAIKPAGADTNYWAPEVHKYNGAYYMFTTYHSSVTGHRGCTIMKADSPEGPFVEITGGHITPRDWDSIDGTFYVDPDGQPWMIFVHEWTSTNDGVGRMAAAKLSDDLTHFISEPIELFRADAPAWSTAKVTDGCWMYRCADGQLLMLWSNWDSAGYCVGIARSADGRVDGTWTQDQTLLYSKSMTGTYDGGHGMLFTDTDGQMYLSLHSPNSATGSRKERPVFIPISEQNGTLVWDLWRGE